MRPLPQRTDCESDILVQMTLYTLCNLVFIIILIMNFLLEFTDIACYSIMEPVRMMGLSCVHVRTVCLYIDLYVVLDLLHKYGDIIHVHGFF